MSEENAPAIEAEDELENAGTEESFEIDLAEIQRRFPSKKALYNYLRLRCKYLGISFAPKY